MSEKRILIASILKPVNDTRMFEKIGLSLSKLSETKIHIVGFCAPLPPAPENITFHPIFNFRRLGLSRFLAQAKYEKLLEELKPDLIIASTHEVLLSSQRYCRKHGAALIYDVQENYALNLTSQQNYPPLLKQLLAYAVRRAEHNAASDIAHYLLAEQSYAAELPFLKQDKFSYIENKYQPNSKYSTPATPVVFHAEPLRILYSGTIADMYGIFEALELAEALYQLNNSTTFTIIGYCAQPHTLQQIRQRIQEKEYIRLIGGDFLVPHADILQAIQESNLGLLPYQPNPSTERCIPTKLYEYMAYALPMIVQQNPLWSRIVAQHQAGITIDYAQMRPQELLNRIRQEQFYTAGVPKNIFWQSEEEKLLPIVRDVIGENSN